MRRLAPFLFVTAFLSSCDITAKEVESCANTCTTVGSCPDVVAPSVNFGGFGDASTENAAADCAASCAQDNRAMYGYSDCQMECIVASGCDVLEQCWDVSSEAYASFCLADRETTPVAPEEGDTAAPTNGTTTGNSDADVAVDNPAVEAAVEDGDFVVNYGDKPPLINGYYHATGEIEESSNARPPGSLINTFLCFSNPTEKEDGTWLTYCEDGVPGSDDAPITGSGDDFTIYLEYPGQATILFSGTVDEAGNPTNVEALVVYLSGVDVWESSTTSWSLDGVCDTCESE